MKTYQIFYRELRSDGTWWQGSLPLKVIFDKSKADRYSNWLKDNASLNQDYKMIES